MSFREALYTAYHRQCQLTGSRNMVAKLRELGVEHKYNEVPGGLHSDVVAPNLAAIVEFFNTHNAPAV